MQVTILEKKMKMNAHPSYLWVISGSLLRTLVHVRMVRHILDQIQNKIINQIYSHLLSLIMNKATPFGCEPENLVEEKATIVSLHEYDEDQMSSYDVIYGLCKYHISL